MAVHRVRLKEIGKSFATRERARELLPSVPLDAETVEIDLDDVRVSPSFLAELLGGLSLQNTHVVLLVAEAPMVRLAQRMVVQLHMGDHVVVETGRQPA